MKEMIVDSVLGFVNNSDKKGVSSIEDWKVVRVDRLVWLVNEKIKLRIREKLDMEK